MQPVCGGRAPIVLTLQPGTYFWCVCGRSSTQPFCDGSHEGTGFEPREVIIEQERRISLCTCKMTTRPPFCDGSHKTLPPLVEGAGAQLGGAALPQIVVAPQVSPDASSPVSSQTPPGSDQCGNAGGPTPSAGGTP